MLAANGTYLAVTAAMAAYTFALGGLVAWVPAFLQRYDGLSMARANDLFGSVTVVAGLSGTLIGGLLGPGLFAQTFAWSIAPDATWHMPGAPFLLAAAMLAAGTALAWWVTRPALAADRSTP